MSEIMKDTAIKLFGKTINLNLLPDNFASDDSVSEQRYSSLPATSTSQDSKDGSLTRSGHEYYESIMNPRDEETLTESSEIDDETNKEEKTVKKPEKILPCPRCKSMDTKFCYFNNYNVNQPRYFCKKCQRYWTSGGTMRNVPVGSGRRKNKATAVPNFHHIMVSDSLQQGFLIAPNSGGYPVSFYPGTTAYWVPTCGLGKRPRDESHETKRSVLIPKTLRIDDPNEAAKSSIWSTLGINNDQSSGSLSGTGLFKAFESKGAGVRSFDSSAMVRQANPAAFSRSINFHERA